MREFFSPEIEKRRRSPTDDFLSALVTANEDGDRLSDEEMFGVCVITLVAGQDTTANTMAMVVDMLAKDRDALSALRAMEAIDANTIMELQRRAAMSTNMARIVAEDFEWEGHHLRKGEFVLLIQAAANHDPSIFPDPEKIDFTRKQTQNMTFAPGVHHCIGHLVAKMILTEFFEVFLRRFDFEIPDHRREYSPGMSFRGLEALPIVLVER
jgi:cytochrome P450